MLSNARYREDSLLLLSAMMMFDIAHAKKSRENAGKDDSSEGMQTFAKDICARNVSRPRDVTALLTMPRADSDYYWSEAIIVDGGMQFH